MLLGQEVDREEGMCSPPSLQHLAGGQACVSISRAHAFALSVQLPLETRESAGSDLSIPVHLGNIHLYRIILIWSPVCRFLKSKDGPGKILS